jgi:hypothetical protein
MPRDEASRTAALSAASHQEGRCAPRSRIERYRDGEGAGEKNCGAAHVFALADEVIE